ncbi:hypothetical protein HYH08_34095 [Bradyrhizobium sp. BR 10289]|nr:hypothetical protein [Bradyrhizobium sp. BR 10289]
MSVDLARSASRDNEHTTIASDHPDILYSSNGHKDPSKTKDSPIYHYVPGKWTWGKPTRSAEWGNQGHLRVFRLTRGS